MLLERLPSQVAGEVIYPGSESYDGARQLFYTGFDRRPAAIVRPAGSSAVAAAVNALRGSGSVVAVRGGGHSLAGHSMPDDGVVIDLSSMRSLEIDRGDATVWADAGLTAGAFAAATAEYGLVTGFGDAPSVGIGGITLGGGVGFLHRKYGLTIDSLLAAEIVTADGRIRRIDETTEPDLFWAIRGGGGNFGVVTRLKFQLQAVDQVTGGMLVLPATPSVIASFLDETLAAPDELAGLVNVTIAPPMPFLPPDRHGTPIILAILVHCGDPGAAQRAFEPFRRLATPLADTLETIRYVSLYEGHDEMPRPSAVAIRTGFIDDFDQGDGDAVLDGLRASSAPMKVVQFRPLGGAVGRVPNESTAFAHRDRRSMVGFAAIYANEDEAGEHTAWVEGLRREIVGDDLAAYVGFMGDEGPDRVRHAYPPATWDRLTAIKARYDPANTFRSNQNIPPAPAG